MLVVDDESAVREAAREALEHHGYLVQEAGQEQKALKLYAQVLEQGQPFDLVLLGLAMPVIDGEKCLEELLRLDLAARLLMATCHGGEQADMEWLEGRAAGLLRKPFDLNTMLD
ncbi:hypothetical protein DFAR_3190002 [Desulfarculales bacterium]